MGFLELVAGRRSIRKYKNAPVEPEKLARCIEAARLAPSACNSQPWKYIAVTDTSVRDRLAAEAFNGIYKATQFAAAAPVIVAVAADKGNFTARIGNFVRHTSFYLIDIGISAENFCLQAAEEGLGTCMIGWFDEKKAARVLGVPAGVKLELLIAVGYPDEAPAPRPRKTVDEMSTFNAYR